MKTLWLDPFSGISGDMMLGLLIDLGLPLETLGGELSKLPLKGYSLQMRRESRMGIEGTRIEVLTEEQHHHRTWLQIDAMIAATALDPSAAALARRIFARVGKAEAQVHGVPLEQVHFHEVGALDSIVDIVGAALGLTLLGIERVVCAPLPLSRGMAQTAHGRFPLPAPATVEILKGIPVVDAACDKELVTPTGAAIAAEVSEFGPLPAMCIEQTGYGVGGWRLADRPNLLRGILGQCRAACAPDTDRVSVLETHLDDANPEWLGALMDELLAAGALDVAFAPLQMKKNRPGVAVTLIAPLPLAETLSRKLLLCSSAIGVRRHEAVRMKLRREARTLATALGEAQVKLIFDGDQLVRITPEYESCKALAKQSARPLPEVYRLVERAADTLFKENGQ